MQIRTTKLQEMLSKAIKGVGNNKQVPITNLISIELKGDTLTLLTTGNNNYLYVMDKIDGEDNFYAVVQAELFAKLIARMTSEMTTLTIANGNLEVRGNGVYTIPVILDDNTGDVVKYPDPAHTKDFTQTVGELSVNTVKTILLALKPALATTMEMPQYVNYFVGDGVMATDTFKIGYLKEKVFDTPTLVSGDLMELLDVISDDETIKVSSSADDKLLFSTSNYLVYGPVVPGIESYNVTAILNYINREYPNSCRLAKAELLQLIDRLSLFVNEAVDGGVVRISFTKDGFEVLSNLSSGVETLPYVEADENFTEYSGSIYLEMLRSHIKAQTGDIVTIWFGDEKSIKLVDDNNGVTSVIGLVQ